MAGVKKAKTKNVEQSNEDSGSLKGVKSLTIQDVAEVYDALIQAFTRSDVVSVELSELENIDAAGLQLLCSAHKFSVAKNKTFCLTGKMREGISKIIADAGFQRHSGCVQDAQRTCLWLS